MKNKTVFTTLLILLTFLTFRPSPIFASNSSNDDVSREPGSPFEIHPEIDIPILLTATAVWTMPLLMNDEIPYRSCTAVCDSDDVNAFDRTAIGYHNEASSMASHIGVVGLPLIAGLASLADFFEFGGMTFLEDLVLIAEALTISGAMHQITRHAFNRPRPYMYIDDNNDSIRRDSIDDYLAFFSGHTSAAFSATVAFAYIFSVRRPDNKWKYAIWAFAIAASSAVGVFRVTAGIHFWTDVLAGGIIGSTFGVLSPVLHRSKKSKKNRAVATSWIVTPATASLTVSF